MTDALTTEQHNVLAVLCEARARLARGWCQHNRGLDSDGNYVEGWWDRAVQWCALGALDVPFHNIAENTTVGLAAVQALAAQIPSDYQCFRYRGTNAAARVADFNNHRSQNDVLAMYDCAIEASQGYAFAAFRSALLESPK